MKDIFKFAGTSLLMIAALILVNMVFFQALMGDIEWINLLITVLYTLVVFLAAFYDGINRGAKDCKYTRTMDKQINERNYQMREDEKQRLYQPAKGFIATLIASSPAILLSLVSIITGGEHMWLNFATRLCMGEYLSVFQYVDALMPWIYLPLSLLYPLFAGVGYLCGPKAWQHQMARMEKAKLEKKRKVNRRRKKKKNM